MAAPERQAAGNQPAESDNAPIEGSIKTSHLLEQALCGTVQVLRTENSYLKGQDLLKEIHVLPPIPYPTAHATPGPVDAI
ncbi:hypothetical protein OG21DRAFT_1484093 [Imleria badia]|nr:hypothetical protein OG21DRAFT_1484093 [Imleria badia]